MWDTAGQEKYKSLVPAYLRDANCCIIVFEIGREESFRHVGDWLGLFREYSPKDSLAVLVGNKADQCRLYNCGFWEEVEGLIQKERMMFEEASAKTGENIHKIFNEIVLILSGQK